MKAFINWDNTHKHTVKMALQYDFQCVDTNFYAVQGNVVLWHCHHLTDELTSSLFIYFDVFNQIDK